MSFANRHAIFRFAKLKNTVSVADGLLFAGVETGNYWGL